MQELEMGTRPTAAESEEVLPCPVNTIIQDQQIGVDSEQDRFVHVSNEDTDSFIVDNRNRNTGYKTKSDLKLFNEWCRTVGELRDPADIPPQQLDPLLARFFLGARKKDGNEYEPDTMSGIQNSIDRYLRDKKMAFSIKRDSTFAHSNKVLEAKRKSLKSQGKRNKTAKAEPLTKEEINILYNMNVLGAGNPESLLNTVWLNNGGFLGFRGRQHHVNLLWGDIELKETSDGKEYLEFNERSTKTRSGAKKGDFRQVAPKVFAHPGNLNCPVNAWKLYRDHRPSDMNVPGARFYLRPLVIKDPSSEGVWFSHQPVGKDKLGKMMATMAGKWDLTGRKVNHSMRKTFATSLVQAGVPPTEVAHLGGWKNLQSINDYSAPSINQQENASYVIGNTLLPTQCDFKEIPTTPSVPLATNTLLSNSINTCNATSSKSAVDSECFPFSLFSGATISGGSIVINITPPEKKRKISHDQFVHQYESSQ